jgi:hypothetical protein
MMSATIFRCASMFYNLRGRRSCMRGARRSRSAMAWDPLRAGAAAARHVAAPVTQSRKWGVGRKSWAWWEVRFNL